MSYYNGRRCDYVANQHVFDESVSAGCGMRHDAIVDTPEENLLPHRVWRLESRLAELERTVLISASQESGSTREIDQLLQ